MVLRVERTSGSELSPRDWERRKEFFGFTDADARLLRNLGPVAEAFVDDVVDELYRRILGFDETKAFLADPATVARVKAAQRVYFLGLTGGDYGEKYLANRLLTNHSRPCGVSLRLGIAVPTNRQVRRAEGMICAIGSTLGV